MATIAELIAKHGWGCTITSQRMAKDSKHRDNWFRPVSFGAHYYRGYSNLGSARYPDEQCGWELYEEPKKEITFYRYTYIAKFKDWEKFGCGLETSRWTTDEFNKYVMTLCSPSACNGSYDDTFKLIETEVKEVEI